MRNVRVSSQIPNSTFLIPNLRRGFNMEKIKMTTPLVEMDGDEMTRILDRKSVV